MRKIVNIHKYSNYLDAKNKPFNETMYKNTINT